MIQENVPIKIGLLDLLRGSQGAQFVIPAYQRNYTWRANLEVKQLIDDIKAVLSGERTKHFIGIMIYLERSINPLFLERSVIDGQQRLTTIFLILYAIKEYMIEKGLCNEAKQLENIYLINSFSETNKYKLKPLVSDDAVYQCIINGNFDIIDNKKSNVYLNYNYIKKFLTNALANYSVEDILSAMNKLYIVCVPIRQEDYPQKIFESINATGAKLTASDLIRNFILMPVKSELQDLYYEKYWKRLEDLIDIDSKKLEAFFRFFIMSKRLALINKNNVYNAFTEWFKENVDQYGEEGILEEIVKYARYFNAIYKAPFDKLENELKDAIKEFRYILSDMPAPLLMELYAIHNRYDENNKPLISSQQLADIIVVLNSYLMRRALCGMDTSDITRYFPTLLKETLADCSGKYDNIVEIFKKNLINRNKGNSQEMPDNRKLQDRIKNANMYNLRTWVSIFFRKLEMYNNPAPVDFTRLSIEHLMPQSPTTEWLLALETNKETYEENLHRLGNLTLAARSDNSKMGNKVWGYKNEILKSTGHLKMNVELLEKEHWTLNEIEARTNFLIAEIARLYPYFEARDSDITKIPISINSQNVSARAYYYPENGSVEILAGSELANDIVNVEFYPEIELLRKELAEECIIQKRDGVFVFERNYMVFPKRSNATGLSTAASLILHGSRNGWEYWQNENGKLIGQIEELRKK